MGLLRGIRTPADLKALSPEQLPTLAEEIRDFLIEHVSVTGGHLGPNLGVVELTLALHRVFDSPEEPFIFDTSHQSYVHKIVTGRADRFTTLRQKDGLSGYTARAESEHDWTESSHASASLAYADGLSKGFALDGRGKHNVVAVVGDGALTGGMCWEALNNIAAGKDRNVVIVVNDNGRSYSPTIGGFAENLAHLRISGPYDGLMEHGKKTLKSMGWVGNRAFEALHAFKEGVKHTVLPTEMFPELGMKYVGPVDGHDFDALDQAFSYAKNYQGPIIVHVVTEKGHGYEHAVNDEADQMHSTGAIDPVTGLPKSKSKPGWTQVFTKELLAAAEKRSDIVAITAAMAGPTGLAPFAERFPDRFFDVGIAEQHAVASASGLALAGFHPVVAVYSTFLNRAFDQLLFDVALLDQPVTLVLDRAGVTGSDGASHNGVWDLSVASVVPGIRIAAPRDGVQLAALFREALLVDDGPTIVRFPKGSLPPELPVWASLADGVDIMHYSDAEKGSDNVELDKSVLVIAVGSMVETAVIAAQAHENVTVVDPGWVSPVAESLYSLASDHDAVLTVEDGIVRGGIGSLVAEEFSAAGITTPVRHLGFPAVFPLHASRNELLAEVGLDVAGISAAISELRRG
ncbi:1-deoxy-D-xylulose-5-phosphate synthase [Corynebacterium propinquum]|uniref:1-deoxy-D-xylulose-5-phosphate synthase n=1 Tax=Corynebacterium propinquum TaxID=43769 RepID=A0AAP4BS02_9CORY|nr:1-deoxy-D-xylulose-5-phosphate synthase [Corynebacterium propinquum]MCG7230751.1 1-deoxy-D-xylulose-5-phosphate synthase [Corynebacterium propinquum]MDK4302380.1 1-deoxy-D-xylulose-5-phosphate synthase [Corynebacterium propinquum]MDK4325340.1 1-deoxy-D-xylulose-5-phosphate synthase [Corynebacterium propinquum]MDK8722514.1 1-deoxy-D-xylulose-5-phosphate synthase [Corynebacterium propinquum]UQV59407.1 1-deoxy-D-xylulose-5-phosphate synthase [Corynebacterium propinquum]